MGVLGSLWLLLLLSGMSKKLLVVANHNFIHIYTDYAFISVMAKIYGLLWDEMQSQEQLTQFRCVIFKYRLLFLSMYGYFKFVCTSIRLPRYALFQAAG